MIRPATKGKRGRVENLGRGALDALGNGFWRRVEQHVISFDRDDEARSVSGIAGRAEGYPADLPGLAAGGGIISEPDGLAVIEARPLHPLGHDALPELPRQLLSGNVDQAHRGDAQKTAQLHKEQLALHHVGKALERPADRDAALLGAPETLVPVAQVVVERRVAEKKIAGELPEELRRPHVLGQPPSRFVSAHALSHLRPPAVA